MGWSPRAGENFLTSSSLSLGENLQKFWRCLAPAVKESDKDDQYVKTLRKIRHRKQQFSSTPPHYSLFFSCLKKLLWVGNRTMISSLVIALLLPREKGESYLSIKQNFCVRAALRLSSRIIFCVMEQPAGSHGQSRIFCNPSSQRRMMKGLKGGKYEGGAR